jgi:hypothetical protein
MVRRLPNSIPCWCKSTLKDRILRLYLNYSSFCRRPHRGLRWS